MSQYEILSVVLSAIAIGFSVFIPLIQWIYKKCFVKPIVKYYPVGLISLLFNQSGSYIQLNGVIESEKKAVSIRKMMVTIKRNKDNQSLNLTWSNFISPVNQRLVGNNIVQTTEFAHPFRINEDSIATTFVEYTDPFDSFGKTFRPHVNLLVEEANQTRLFSSDYNEAKKKYTNSEKYIAAKRVLSDEFFWKVGKYDLDIVVLYNNTEQTYKYEFSISDNNYADLSSNLDESIIVPLKNIYKKQWDFRTVNVEIKNREK